jgi:ring-1,2-phenylacetyl-CoA epoxidase subunit PaaD
MEMTNNDIGFSPLLAEKEEMDKIWKLLEEVSDPEVPVLSVLDLGIVREVKRIDEAGETAIEVVITPTYSGCPAMDMIAMNIRMQLLSHGHEHIKITSVLSPPWTTEWMSEEGKRKLKEYGIAAPHSLLYLTKTAEQGDDVLVECPQCNSTNTRLLSQFGSTACKALYQCNDCKEPFDHFKCH